MQYEAEQGKASSLSRRQVLQTALVAGGATVLSAAISSPASAAEEYDTLRLRRRDQLLGVGFDPAAAPYAAKLAALGSTANTYWSTFAPTSGALWPDRVYADPEPDNDAESTAFANGMGESYSRLKTMALAYVQPGTGLTGNTNLRAAIISGLDQLYAEVFHEGLPVYGGWWHWRIGAPTALMDTCVLLYDHLSATQIANYVRAVDHFVPDSYLSLQTGANLVDLCKVLALRGVIGKTPAKLVTARDGLAPVFPYVTTKDGFYRDGSFIQHLYIPYTGSYGAVLIDGVAALMAMLAGSTWQITDPNRQVIFDAVEKAYAPFLYNGLIMNGVVGRGAARGLTAADPLQIQSDDHLSGHSIIASILRLAISASAWESARWRGLAKGWLQRDYYSPVANDPGLTVPAQALCLGVLNDSSVTAIAEPTGHRLFHNMDRATHRRPGWSWSVSMCSARTAYYETINGENLRG